MSTNVKAEVPEAQASGGNSGDKPEGYAVSLSKSAVSPISTTQFGKLRGWSWGYDSVSQNFRIYHNDALKYEIYEDSLGTAQTVFESTLAREWKTVVSSPSVRGSNRFTVSNMLVAAKDLGFEGLDPVEVTQRAVQKIIEKRLDGEDEEVYSFDDILCLKSKKNLPTSGVVTGCDGDELNMLKKWLPLGMEKDGDYYIVAKTALPSYSNLEEAVNEVLNTKCAPAAILEPEEVTNVSNQVETAGDLSLLKELFRYKDFNSLKNLGNSFAQKHVDNMVRLKDKKAGGLSQVAEKGFAKQFFPMGNYTLEEFVNKTLEKMADAGKSDLFAKTGISAVDAVLYMIFLRQSQMVVDFRSNPARCERKA